MPGMLQDIMTEENDTLGDINHTPPAGDSVSNVWNRGHEQDD